jgi:2-aminoethylphosphonate-pyruvate transaminase
MTNSTTFSAISNPTIQAGRKVREAVILAAGLGSRLNELGVLTPKALLRLGDRPIVEEAVERLLSVGIERVVIVTGHLAEHFDPIADRYPGIIELVHNPLFADSGSMYSLYCARSFVEGDFLLLESDLIFERRALDECLASTSESVLLLSGFSHTNDEVFVASRRGFLRAMSKNRRALVTMTPGAVLAGELVGISKISQALFSIMVKAAKQYFLRSLHMDYETDCLVLAARTRPMDCVKVEDLVWCEIDNLDHLRRARTVIYPAVVAKDRHEGRFQELTA